ncbi:MAG: DUF6036 family nucleotidyltransferase [Verrucomicrobiota bacterium]|nr:DUF6036 family nucleotidyltransferase [Verrucomicrobiota bacterium]
MLNKDFKEFIELLNKNDVQYLLIGGYAVALHGHPRYTKNIDSLIGNTQDNAKKMMHAITEFGCSSLGLTFKDFMSEKNIIQLGFPPVRIDIITNVNGVDFSVLYENRKLFKIDDIELSLINLEDLKKIKKIAGRHQDLADIEALEE